MGKRRKFSAEYKARLVLELLCGQRSAADIACKEHIKDALLYEWQSQFRARAYGLQRAGTQPRVEAKNG